MKKHVSKTILAVALALAACAACLAGCAANGSLNGETLEETGAFKVTAENAGTGSTVKAEAAATIGEGDVLLVSPDLTSGAMKVTLTDKSGNIAFDEEVDGRILDTYEVAAGTYDIAVECTQAPTTGALVVNNLDAEEWEQRDDDLLDALEREGVSQDSIDELSKK